MFGLILYLLVTLGISVFNASQSGRYWSEKDQLPAGIRLLIWSGTVMSVCGFFVSYVIIVTMAMRELNLFEAYAAFLNFEISTEEVEMLTESIFNLSYLIVYFPLMGSGLAIWGNSVAVAFHRRNVISIGIAGYNSWAMWRNTLSGIRYIPQASRALFETLGSLFKGKSGRTLLGLLALLVLPIVISLGGAIMSTALIIRATDERYRLEDSDR